MIDTATSLSTRGYFRILKSGHFNFLLTLWVRIKRRRKRAAAIRGPAPVPSAPGQCWSMDFVTDRLLDGRAFQALTVVDNFSRY